MVFHKTIPTSWLRPWRPLLISMLVLWCGVSTALDPRYDGQKVVEVEVVGLSTLPQETLEHYLLGRGESGVRTLDQADLNERIKKLWKRELIDEISVDLQPVEGGVKLVVRIEERPILTSVEYVGIKRASRGDIVERIDRERISVYEGQSLKLGELRRLKSAIEEMYREKGYRFAQVNYSLEEVTRGQMRATFTIDEGDKVKIGDIGFDGNTVFNDWRLRTTMRKTKESGLISKISKKDIYNPANIDEDLEKIKDIYRKAGYKDVLIGRPEIEVVAKRPNAEAIEDQKRRLAVTVPVEEGDRWRLGEVSIEGNDVFTDQALLRMFEEPRGGWLRSKIVDDAMEKIEKLYNSVGYIFARFETELREQTSGKSKVADVVVHIDESEQYRVGRIVFDGNEKTRDKVLRREMLVQEGTVMNMNAVQNSMLKIRQLNYFALNEEEPIKFDFDDEKKIVDLVVQGDEADRTELQFGGGWSELDGFFGQFSMRTTNFLGRGETLGLSFQSGRQRDVFDVSYNIPWFLDRPQNIGFRAFDQSFDYSILAGVDFQQKFSGASITYGRGLGSFQSLNLTYSFQDIEDIRTRFEPDGTPVTVPLTFRSSSIRPFWIYNTIDSRFEPTRGLRMTGSMEVAGGFLGSDTEFIKPVFNMTYFRPMSRKPVKTSFGFNMELGYIEPFGDTDLFAQQRFFLGGENSVRGFRRRSIVVRELDGSIAIDELGFPLGGEQMVQANLEYHFILGGPFRTILFADAGGAFRREDSIDLGRLRSSAGIELRIMVPVFGAPLRFIYATNLDPLPNDQFETFDFNIGTSF